jgi:predicted component of type VI protein secretion system
MMVRREKRTITYDRQHRHRRSLVAAALALGLRSPLRALRRPGVCAAPRQRTPGLTPRLRHLLEARMSVKRWEYTHIVIQRRDNTPASQTDHVHPEDLDEVLNRAGAAGWEVWQLDGSIVRLKREVVDACAAAG